MGHFFLLILVSGQLLMVLVETREIVTLHGPPRGTFGIFPTFKNPFDDLTMSLSEIQPVFAQPSSNHPMPAHLPQPPDVHNFRMPRKQAQLKVTEIPLAQMMPSTSNTMPVYRENRVQNINSGSSAKTPNLRTPSFNPQQSHGTNQNQNRQVRNNVRPQPQFISLPSIRVENKHSSAPNHQKQLHKNQNNHVKRNQQPMKPKPTPPPNNNNFVFVSPIKLPLFGQPVEFGSPEPDQYGQTKNNNHLFSAEHYQMKENTANRFQPMIPREPIRENLNNGREIQFVNIIGNFQQESHSPANNNRHTHRPGAKKENEALNVFNHGMQEIKPQLPPRPSFHNGGLQINAIREQLPILHVNNVNVANNGKNPNQNEQYTLNNGGIQINAIREQLPVLHFNNVNVANNGKITNQNEQYALENGGIQINAIREQLPILHFSNADVANNGKIPNQNEHYTLDNGGIQINAMRDQLPILHLSNGNIANSGPIPNQNEQYIVDNLPEHKKTFLVFKAPALVTTERPPSAPFSVNTVDTVQSNIRTPEFDYPPTTQPPPTIMTHNIEAPGLVFDLLQIPVDDVYEDVKNRNVGVVSKEHRTVVNNDFTPIAAPPRQNYPTTPMYENDDVKKHSETYEHKEYHHKPSPEKVYQSFHSAANISSLPVSYSSSVSAVIAQSPNAKPKTTKVSKMTLKKSLPAKKKVKSSVTQGSEDDGSYGHESVPGRPGADYPTYNEIPFTNFDCRDIKAPGFYADLEAGCQVFHNCDMEMKKHSFMCPNGTIFHQELFICDWWYNVNCDDSSEFYTLNEGLYIEDEKNQKSKAKE